MSRSSAKGIVQMFVYLFGSLVWMRGTTGLSTEACFSKIGQAAEAQSSAFGRRLTCKMVGTFWQAVEQPPSNYICCRGTK